MKVILLKVSSLGDSLSFLPLVEALSRQVQGVEVHVFTTPISAPLYAGLMDKRNIHACDRAEFHCAKHFPLTLAKYVQNIRRLKPDVIGCGDDQPNTAYLMAATSGAKVRIGPDRDFIKIPGALTQRIARSRGQAVPAWNWAISRAILAEAGVHHQPEDMPVPEFSWAGIDCVPEADVVIHPGAGKSYQRWPAERYRDLANQFAASGRRVLWVEEPFTEKLKLNEAIQRHRPADTLELLSIFKRAKFCVLNNSGPMHLASLAGCPGVVITGPSAYSWDPVWHRDRFKVLRRPELTCQPCDPPDLPLGHCLFNSEKHACLLRWSVDDIRAICEDRMPT